MGRFVRREHLVLVVTTCLWGSGQTAGKLALRELHPGHLAVLRPACACLVLTVLVVASGRASRVVGELRASPGILMALGLLGYAGAGGSTGVALSLMPAGITSLLTATSPLMLVIGSMVLVRGRVRVLQGAGAVVGFCGVVILSGGGLLTAGGMGLLVLLGVQSQKSVIPLHGVWPDARRHAGRAWLALDATATGTGFTPPTLNGSTPRSAATWRPWSAAAEPSLTRRSCQVDCRNHNMRATGKLERNHYQLLCIGPLT